MNEVECIVIGAGAVGLACAAALARYGREVIVLEAQSAIGTQTSSRNSEVIHAGIYYPPGSLKAKLCLRGKQQIYSFAKDRGVAHANTAKLIVAANSDQVTRLETIRQNAIASGVTDLEMLNRAQVERIEPAIQCEAALYSPSTGIIDSHAYMLALQGELEANGGMVVCNTPVAGGRISGNAIIVDTAGDEPGSVKTRLLVNSAGLNAPALARSIKGISRDAIPREYYAIGHYYSLSGASPCQRLIYPVPEPGGLGIHLTVDLAGQARFGPDVRWIDGVDYSFDESGQRAFVEAIQSYLPEIAEDRLVPAFTGIRPKIAGPNQPAADFRLAGPSVHGVPGLINLFGIESPGLTASLAIGDCVAAMVR